MPEKSIGENKGITREPRIIDRRSYLKTVGATGGGLALGGMGLSETGLESARAATTIIDDFEDGDLSEYEHDTTRDGRAAIVSSPTYDGSYAMEINNENAELISTSGLAAYPAAGDTFSYWIRGTGGADDVNLSYGVQDHNNRYFVRVDIANNDLMLARYQSGSITWLNKNTGGFTLSQDTWYEVEVAWSGSGDHTATIYDGSGSQVAQVSASGDSTWTSGGIGYDAYLGSGESVFFDYVTLESSDGGGSSTDSKSPNGPDVSGGGVVIDNFEDGDLSEYTYQYQDLDAATVVTNPVKHGDNSLKVTEESQVATWSDPTPRLGTTVSYYVRGATDGTISFLYGVQDHWHHYNIDYDFGGDTVRLQMTEDDGGGLTTDGTQKNVTLNKDTWYKTELNWSRDGTHTVTVYDSGTQIVQLSYDESTWKQNMGKVWRRGGVGFRSESSSATGYFDAVIVESFDDSGAGVIVDDFEDGDLNEYTFTSGSSGASVVSSPTLNGSKALEISGTNTEMYKESKVLDEPEAGDVFSYWVRATGGAGSTGVANVTYGVQDDSNRYYLQLDFADNWLGLAKYEGGSATWLDSASITYQEDMWYKVKVDWRTNGRHIVTLTTGDGNVTVEGTDTTWMKGGVGYDAYVSDGGTVYFDYVTKNRYQPTDAGKVVDDFDDGDLSEYTVVQGSATTTSSPTYFGSNALEISASDTELVSTSGLPRYPSSGDRFRYRVRATGGASDAKLLYGVQGSNTDERYAITIDFINDDVGLYYENGSTQTLLAEDTTSCILTEDEWFRVEVDWRDDGTHTVSLYNDSEDHLVRISETDNSVTSGGVGFSASLSASGGSVYFDHALVNGMVTQMSSLIASHGEIIDGSHTTLSSIDGDRRVKTTYEFEDGTTHEVERRVIDNKTIKTTGDSKYWQVVPQEGRELTEIRRDIVDGFK